MPTRAEQRRYALEVLFEADLRDIPPTEVLTERRGRPAGVGSEDDGKDGDPAGYPHAVRLIEGVAEHRERIDELLSTHATGWTLERMPAVDRSALRMGAFEVLWVDDVPDRVAIREAMALVREMSTDDSPHFVNGLLSRLEEIKPTVVAPGATGDDIAAAEDDF
jgi:N utilization substance protein B